ncbi:hypothetical protein M406DRAFT_357114 [Cryphonectria parasitica EP155]|uniref:Uncharacterized protein n=1 Tax=Cryphonectria parasitica (strain ATCC 38755 / EP155) TaxID=660469 RepID=A0A9P4XZB5_CRYP1|nr:uncharacterized protein M406DRAFT_357114 [Cryphonectria parasitica EP155]KAF3763542.1 hypothetical protein M406DRAFT_357114 [Cryphonectria parasitica EP155]
MAATRTQQRNVASTPDELTLRGALDLGLESGCLNHHRYTRCWKSNYAFTYACWHGLGLDPFSPSFCISFFLLLSSVPSFSCLPLDSSLPCPSLSSSKAL